MNRTGECGLNTLAWHEGMAEWKPLHSVTAVVDSIIPAPPVKNAIPASSSLVNVQGPSKTGEQNISAVSTAKKQERPSIAAP